MSLASNIQSAFTRVATEFKSIRTLISGSGTGTVSGLTTTATNLVSAINEVNAKPSGGATNLDGLSDVVNQRRMIDDSPAPEAFKRVQRGKLDALLALAEAHDCRRVRLLAYFGEPSSPCGALHNACDNCRQPPRTWNATEPARMVLSCGRQ